MPNQNVKKTQCKQGHEYTAENTYLWRGHRHCRACAKAVTSSLKEKVRRRLLYRNNAEFKSAAKSRARAHYKKTPREEHRAYVNNQREEKKIRVLTHYGKGVELKCCWRGCLVCDVDMLSIDHVNDDGAKHRRNMKGNRVYFAGKEMYQWLESQGFPEGFQTLCMNHQVKKQRMKNRADRLDSK
jgi:hypothetical protein